MTVNSPKEAVNHQKMNFQVIDSFNFQSALKSAYLFCFPLVHNITPTKNKFKPVLRKIFIFFDYFNLHNTQIKTFATKKQRFVIWRCIELFFKSAKISKNISWARSCCTLLHMPALKKRNFFINSICVFQILWLIIHKPEYRPARWAFIS